MIISTFMLGLYVRFVKPRLACDANPHLPLVFGRVLRGVGCHKHPLEQFPYEADAQLIWEPRKKERC